MSNNQEKCGAHEVAAYLRRHPRFLQCFPDLALSMVVPREDGPAASLASYQLEVLRDKNRELNRRLRELFSNAQVNERLAVRTHQLTLALMKQASAADTLRAMAAALAEDFDGDLIRMVLFAPVPGLEEADWLRTIPRQDPALAPFADFIQADAPLCGRLHPDKHALLYGERGAEVSSSALLPLTGTGFVAIGSGDGNRFYPGMGILFLRMMADALRVGLQRFQPSAVDPSAAGEAG